MSIKSPEVVQNTEAYDDEIDLRELFTVLWDGKLVITLITGFAAVALNAQKTGANRNAKILSKPFHLRELVQEVDRILQEEAA